MERTVAGSDDGRQTTMLAEGSMFGRYRVERCIGVGGMGSVFEATHTLLKKRVALKTMHASLVRSEAARTRFLREAETVARVRHPNVIDIADVGIEGDVPYLVMEFLEGEDLARTLERAAPLSCEAAVDAVLPIVCGLFAVHRLGIVHRDVKPDNVLMARMPSGGVSPTLLDFGVSKDLDRGTRPEGSPNTVTGTPQYMSPEQASGAAALDGRADQYSAAVMLYQCLTGRLPFESPSLIELIRLIDAGTFRPLRQLRDDLPPHLTQAVHRALSRHPRDRFPDMRQFGLALLPYAGGRVRQLYEDELTKEAPSREGVSRPSDASEGDIASSRTIPGAPTPSSHATHSGVPTHSGVRARGEAVTAAEVDDDAPRIRRRVLLITLAVTATGALSSWLLSARVEPTPSQRMRPAKTVRASYELSVTVRPDDALITLDGATVGRGGLSRRLDVDGKPHVMRIIRPGYESRELTFVDAPPSERIIVLTPSHMPLAEVEPESSPKKGQPSRRARPAAEPPPAALDIQLHR